MLLSFAAAVLVTHESCSPYLLLCPASVSAVTFWKFLLKLCVPTSLIASISSFPVVHKDGKEKGEQDESKCQVKKSLLPVLLI